MTQGVADKGHDELEFFVKYYLVDFLSTEDEQMFKRWKGTAERWAVEDGAKKDSPLMLMYLAFGAGFEQGFEFNERLTKLEKEGEKNVIF